jgi:hypothetical protein
MSRPNDSSYEMFGDRLDQDTADRLLAGAIEPDDAPPGFGEAARIVGALNLGPSTSELVDERVAVAAAVRVLQAQVPDPANVRRWRMNLRSRAKLGAVVVIGTLIGTAGMAAANALPDVAQDAVANALAHVGVTVPHSGTDPTSVDHPAATGDEISTIATTTDATGVAKGAEVSTAASGGVSQAGAHGGGSASGQAGGSAVVETPNPGGTGTADGASGGADATGSGTADPASGGHADEGSANASSPVPTPAASSGSVSGRSSP